jgi:hypothetical protein
MSDIKDRQIYYDGKQVVVYAPKLGVYGQFTAAGDDRTDAEGRARSL